MTRASTTPSAAMLLCLLCVGCAQGTQPLDEPTTPTQSPAPNPPDANLPALDAAPDADHAPPPDAATPDTPPPDPLPDPDEPPCVEQVFFPDGDGDGYGDTGGAYVRACQAPSGYLPRAGDCDDDDPARHPGAAETPGDGLDSDCNGKELCFLDSDSDGVRLDDSSTVESRDADCDDPTEANASAPTGDCDDANPQRHPNHPEICDTADNNCDDQADEGADCSCTPYWNGTTLHLLCSQPKPFWEAYAHCQAQGGFLADAQDLNENLWLATVLSDLGQERAWLGLTDEVQEGNFVWVGPRQPAWRNWARGEPNNDDGDEHCVELNLRSNPRGLWNDAQCGRARIFACEFP